MKSEILKRISTIFKSPAPVSTVTANCHRAMIETISRSEMPFMEQQAKEFFANPSVTSVLSSLWSIQTANFNNISTGFDILRVSALGNLDALNNVGDYMAYADYPHLKFVQQHYAHLCFKKVGWLANSKLPMMDPIDDLEEYDPEYVFKTKAEYADNVEAIKRLTRIYGGTENRIRQYYSDEYLEQDSVTEYLKKLGKNMQISVPRRGDKKYSPFGDMPDDPTDHEYAYSGPRFGSALESALSQAYVRGKKLNRIVVTGAMLDPKTNMLLEGAIADSLKDSKQYFNYLEIDLGQYAVNKSNVPVGCDAVGLLKHTDTIDLETILYAENPLPLNHVSDSYVGSRDTTVFGSTPALQDVIAWMYEYLSDKAPELVWKTLPKIDLSKLQDNPFILEADKILFEYEEKLQLGFDIMPERHELSPFSAVLKNLALAAYDGREEQPEFEKLKKMFYFLDSLELYTRKTVYDLVGFPHGQFGHGVEAMILHQARSWLPNMYIKNSDSTLIKPSKDGAKSLKKITLKGEENSQTIGLLTDFNNSTLCRTYERNAILSIAALLFKDTENRQFLIDYYNAGCLHAAAGRGGTDGNEWVMLSLQNMVKAQGRYPVVLLPNYTHYSGQKVTNTIRRRDRVEGNEIPPFMSRVNHWWIQEDETGHMQLDHLVDEMKRIQNLPEKERGKKEITFIVFITIGKTHNGATDEQMKVVNRLIKEGFQYGKDFLIQIDMAYYGGYHIGEVTGTIFARLAEINLNYLDGFSISQHKLAAAIGIYDVGNIMFAVNRSCLPDGATLYGLPNKVPESAFKALDNGRSVNGIFDALVSMALYQDRLLNRAIKRQSQLTIEFLKRWLWHAQPLKGLDGVAVLENYNTVLVPRVDPYLMAKHHLPSGDPHLIFQENLWKKDGAIAEIVKDLELNYQSKKWRENSRNRRNALAQIEYLEQYTQDPGKGVPKEAINDRREQLQAIKSKLEKANNLVEEIEREAKDIQYLEMKDIENMSDELVLQIIRKISQSENNQLPLTTDMENLVWQLSYDKYKEAFAEGVEDSRNLDRMLDPKNDGLPVREKLEHIVKVEQGVLEDKQLSFKEVLDSLLIGKDEYEEKKTWNIFDQAFIEDVMDMNSISSYFGPADKAERMVDLIAHARTENLLRRKLSFLNKDYAGKLVDALTKQLARIKEWKENSAKD